jgi:hypothetical protein
MKMRFQLTIKIKYKQTKEMINKELNQDDAERRNKNKRIQL